MSEQIPGAAAIPPDMPDAPHGDVSLEYNLQNFNALVAANTAMTGEISGLNLIIGDLRERLAQDARVIAAFNALGTIGVSLDRLAAAAEARLDRDPSLLSADDPLVG